MGTPEQGVDLVDYRNRFVSLQSKQWKMTGKWFHFPVDSTPFEWSLTLFMTLHRDFDPKLVPREAPLTDSGRPEPVEGRISCFKKCLIAH
jgi:hypothetical protein